MIFKRLFCKHNNLTFCKLVPVIGLSGNLLFYRFEFVCNKCGKKIYRDKR